MTALDKLRDIARQLSFAGIDEAAKEAEVIITETLGIDRVSLYSGRYEISEEDSERISSIVLRRIKREPLQYILGYVEFLGLRFKVGKGVLIPRPETELLAQEAIKILKTRDAHNVLDLCSGSGCIAITIAKYLPHVFVYGIEISETALSYAEENALLNNVKNVRFLRGDLYEPLRLTMPQITFDMIVSNPPYIRSEDLGSLQPEIRDWEPIEALNGGSDGLYYYRRILESCRDFLVKNGDILLEVGNCKGVMDIASSHNLKVISVIQDLSGIERILHLTI